MPQNLKQLYGRKLSACDGLLGWIHDFYFDEATWTVRYVVVDAGGWLSDRQIIFPVGSFESYPWSRTKRVADPIHVNSDRRRLASGPVLGLREPFTRKLEAALLQHHGFPERAAEILSSGESMDSTGLHRTRTVTGFRLQTRDGAGGTVSGFLLPSRSWVIEQIVVATGAWFFGRELLLGTDTPIRILPQNRSLEVSHSTQELYAAAQ